MDDGNTVELKKSVYFKDAIISEWKKRKYVMLGKRLSIYSTENEKLWVTSELKS